MDKKKKRASFTIDTATPKPPENVTELVKEDPTIKQVVEVVVQDKTQSGKAPNINIVIPQPYSPEPKVDEDVVEAVTSMPNLIDDGTDEEEPIPPEHLDIINDELSDEDDSTVTASATPQGDSVVVRQDPDILEDEVTEKVKPTRVLVDDLKDEAEIKTPPQKTPEIKIHNNVSHGIQSDTEREEAVAELFGGKNQSVMPEITVHKHTQTRGIILWAIAMVTVALGVGGGLVLFTNRYDRPSSPTATPSPTITPSAVVVVPTATNTPALVKRSEVRIQILNGGGKPGAGSRMKLFLEEKGYRVVETRNADSYTYESTEIVVKKSKEDILDTLSTDLEESYELGESKSDLPESSSYDARVIVGENE